MENIELTDEELYNKIQSLCDDDETFGCYAECHCDIEQWKRVSVDWLKTECDMEVPEQYREAEKGYYKVTPQRNGRCILTFSRDSKRGAKAVMEMRYC